MHTSPPTPPTIEIPRQHSEAARAYAAKVAYVTMGAGRSLERVAECAQSAPEARPTKRLATLKAWSARFGWVDCARHYDAQLAAVAAREHAEQYQRDVAAHREKARRASGDLYVVAGALLQQCARAVRGQVIKGEDGKEYTIPKMEISPAALAVAIKGLLTALDMEAHALQLDQLLPALEPRDRE